MNGNIVLKTVLEVMFELDFEREIGNTEREEKLGFTSPCFQVSTEKKIISFIFSLAVALTTY